MAKLICWILGHNWTSRLKTYKHGHRFLVEECTRCGKRRVTPDNADARVMLASYLNKPVD